LRILLGISFVSFCGCNCPDLDCGAIFKERGF
jgi:hypothetical protein